MTDTISLELAKEIASIYEQLGVEAPKAQQSAYFYYNNGFEKWFPCYTAAEIFDALPVGTMLAKGDCFYHAWNYNFDYGYADNESPTEALGLMLCRFLDDKIKEGGAR